jgi:hypothetical protein
VTGGAGIHAADQRAPSHRCNPGRSTRSAPPKMTKIQDVVASFAFSRRAPDVLARLQLPVHFHVNGFSFGSCVASVRWQVPKAHPSDQLGCDSFRIHHGFIRRHVEMQVWLVNTPKNTQVGPERCAGSLAGIGVHLAPAIAIIIPGPFVDAVAHGGVGRVAATIALPFICIQDCALQRDVFGDQGSAGALVRTVAHPQALLARVARDNADDGGPIVGVGPMAFALIGASTRRVTGIAMGRAVFPPRSGTMTSTHSAVSAALNAKDTPSELTDRALWDLRKGTYDTTQ